MKLSARFHNPVCKTLIKAVDNVDNFVNIP